MRNLHVKFGILCFVLGGASLSFADACSYCERLKKIETGLSQVKPDPLNTKTGERQGQLVDEAGDLIEDVLKEKEKNLSDQDVERLAALMARVRPYDNGEVLPMSLVDVIRPYQKRFDAEFVRQEKLKMIEPGMAELLSGSFVRSEGAMRVGTDPDDGLNEKLAPPKKADETNGKTKK